MDAELLALGRRFQSIVDKTMEDYPFENVYGEAFDATEYTSHVPLGRMLRDVGEMEEAFSACVGDGGRSLDDISAVFAMLCTCCAKSGLDRALGPRFRTEDFLTRIADDRARRLLLALGALIFGLVRPREPGDKNWLEEACRLFPDNEIVNLYRFIGLIQLLYTDDGEEPDPIGALLAPQYAGREGRRELIRRDMVAAYAKLSEVLKTRVITGKDESDGRDDNLPYVEYVPSSERFMDACLSDFHMISEGAGLDGEAIRGGPLLWKVLEASLGEIKAEAEGRETARQPVSLGLIFLLDRLSDVHSGWAEEEPPDGAEPPRAEDRAAYPYPPALRELYLAVPSPVEPSAEDFHTLFSETLRAETRTAERDRAMADKAAVIRDFTHTYGNMKATGLYSMARALLKSEDLEIKRLGRQALLEYGIKQDLTKDVYMLRLRFEEDIAQLRRILRGSLAPCPGEDTQDIQAVLSAALELSLLRVFYDTSDQKAGLARTRLKKAAEGGKLNPLRDSFEQAVIFAGGDTVDWMSRHAAPVERRISDRWRRAAFYRESYASIFLRGIFAECFFNALKYADLREPILLELGEDAGGLFIRFENTAAEPGGTYSGVGLASKSAMLDAVNGRTGSGSVTWGETEGRFRTTVRLDSRVLKGEWEDGCDQDHPLGGGL